MASISNINKFSVKATVSYSGESSGRTVSGLNITSGGSAVETGPFKAAVVDAIINMFNNLSDGNVTGASWVVESQVDL